MNEKSYIRTIAQQIRARVGQSSANDRLDDLFNSYAVLALAKGGQVTNRDVHNAWSAWATKYEPDNISLVPFGELSREIQEVDTLFAKAIRDVAMVINEYNLD